MCILFSLYPRTTTIQSLRVHSRLRTAAAGKLMLNAAGQALGEGVSTVASGIGSLGSTLATKVADQDWASHRQKARATIGGALGWLGARLGGTHGEDANPLMEGHQTGTTDAASQQRRSSAAGQLEHDFGPLPDQGAGGELGGGPGVYTGM